MGGLVDIYVEIKSSEQMKFIQQIILTNATQND